VRTVQEDVETALARVLRTPQPPSLTVAGRTDAGVHARGQVAHLDVPEQVWEAAAGAALGRLNGVLAPDVRVHAIGLVPAGFDARFSAVWRRYEYRIADAVTGYDPLEMARFFEKLQAQGSAGNGLLANWLSDHPAPGNRVQAVQAEIRYLPKASYRESEPGTAARVKSIVAKLPPPPKKQDAEAR